MTYEAWFTGRLAASGPTLGGLDGCRFHLELRGASDSEWRIHDPARKEVVIIRGGSRSAVIVDGRLVEVIPPPYGQLLALARVRDHHRMIEPSAPCQVSTSDSGTTLTYEFRDLTMTVKANSVGWVVSKTVRSSEGVIDAVELLDFTHGSTGSPQIDVPPDTFDDRGARQSWRMGS